MNTGQKPSEELQCFSIDESRKRDVFLEALRDKWNVRNYCCQ